MHFTSRSNEKFLVPTVYSDTELPTRARLPAGSHYDQYQTKSLQEIHDVSAARASQVT